MKLFTYEVRARLGQSFPIDMLRYDSAWPADPASVALVAQCAIPMSRIERPTDASIKLTGIHAPTVARWDSFGWKVVSVNGADVSDATQRAIASGRF